MHVQDGGELSNLAQTQSEHKCFSAAEFYWQLHLLTARQNDRPKNTSLVTTGDLSSMSRLEPILETGS